MNTSIGVLLYRRTCAKCRILSQLVSMLSRHTLDRVPLDSDRAAAYLQRYPTARGKLVLITTEGHAVGRRAALEAARRTVRAWLP